MLPGRDAETWDGAPCFRCTGTRFGLDLVSHRDWRTKERCLHCQAVRDKPFDPDRDIEAILHQEKRRHS